MNIRSIHTLLRLLPITIGITLGVVPAKAQSDESVDEQTLRVALRMVGRQLLLQAGDSLSRVWQDEGDYVGRTLDVFVSNLRKKLRADPRVKIVNIRGVGYKLVVNG